MKDRIVCRFQQHNSFQFNVNPTLWTPETAITFAVIHEPTKRTYFGHAKDAAQGYKVWYARLASLESNPPLNYAFRVTYTKREDFIYAVLYEFPVQSEEHFDMMARAQANAERLTTALQAKDAALSLNCDRSNKSRALWYNLCPPDKRGYLVNAEPLRRKALKESRIKLVPGVHTMRDHVKLEKAKLTVKYGAKQAMREEIPEAPGWMKPASEVKRELTSGFLSFLDPEARERIRANHANAELAQAEPEPTVGFSPATAFESTITPPVVRDIHSLPDIELTREEVEQRNREIADFDNSLEEP